MLEFAIVIGVVLTILLAIIDLSLYFNSYLVARETARQMTQRAIVDSNFSIDTRRTLAAGVATPPSPEDTTRVSQARSRIIEDSFRVYNASLLRGNRDEGTDDNNFVRYKYDANGFGTAFNNDAPLDALLLRPGEQAQVEIKKDGGSTESEVIMHPSCVGNPESTEVCRDNIRKPGREAWTFMQRNLPFYAQVQANYNSIIFGNIQIRAESVAWKDLVASNELSDFADIPPPQTCAEAHPDPDALCATMWNSVNGAGCDFFPNNTVAEECTSCQSCQEFTSASAVCSDCGGINGNDTHECDFRENNRNNNCGSCVPRNLQCGSPFATVEEICAACGGVDDEGNDLEECNFNTGATFEFGGDRSSCGGCTRITGTCDSIGVTAQDVCASCADNNQETDDMICNFNGSNTTTAGSNFSECGSCIERTGECTSFTDASTVCNQCGGSEGNATQDCEFNSGTMTTASNQNRDCGGCVFKECIEITGNENLNNGDQNSAINDREADCGCDIETESCEFLADNNVSQGCFSCRPLTCRERFTEEEVEEFCANFEEENPDRECVFGANNTNGQCFGTGGRFRTCQERQELGLVDVEAQCTTACNDETQTCVTLSNSRAGVCVSCEPKPCTERGIVVNSTDTEVCTLVDGAPTTNEECVSCRARTCEEAGVAVEDVCGPVGCASGTECQFNPGNDVGNCGSCQQCPDPDCDITNNEILSPSGCSCVSCLPQVECPATGFVESCICNENISD